MSPHHPPRIQPDDELDVVDQALTKLETLLAQPNALAVPPRPSLARVSCSRSGASWRRALSTLAPNPALLPSSLNLTDAQTALATLDRLRPRAQRLQQLVEHVQNIEVTLGNEVLNCALKGYALLRSLGMNQCLEALLHDLPVPQGAERAAHHEDPIPPPTREAAAHRHD